MIYTYKVLISFVIMIYLVSNYDDFKQGYALIAHDLMTITYNNPTIKE